MVDVDTSGGKRRRNKRWPEALKREIVVASLAPGASVSFVARQYDVNANQVFAWRRRYGEAAKSAPILSSLPAPSGPASSGVGRPTPQLVPVTITAGSDSADLAPATSIVSEAIEIEVSGDYRVRVGTGFDSQALKRVLDILRVTLR